MTLNEMITGKKILFISPEFFGIDKSIMSSLEEKGAEVYWIDERSVKSSFGRAVNAICPYIFYFQSNRYYHKQLDRISCDIDIILVIKGEMISKKVISLFKEKYRKAKLILYLYDPVKNIKGILKKTSLYDRVISFEPKDCDKFNFEFRPLFCDIKTEQNSKEFFDNDICFYGTMYGDRFEIVNKVRIFCSKNGYKFYAFCFLRGKFMALYYWLTNAGFRKMGLKAVSFIPKKSSEISELVCNSRVILDANDVNQGGLTIRTLETLVSGKKIITTNKNILNYDLYNSDNVYIIDRNNIEIDKEFLNKPYRKIDNEIIKKYTVEGWIKDVFRE